MLTTAVNPEIFRAYDIRGNAERDLPPAVVRRLGWAAGVYFRERGESHVLVGRDNRLSSERIRDDLVRGLAAAGCRISDIGTVITPLFYFAREYYRIRAGIMVTASHNPPEDNGFKIALGDGMLYGEALQQIRSLMEWEAAEQALSWPVTGEVRFYDPREQYLALLTDRIRLGPRKLRVVVDSGNGAAGPVAVALLERLGCRVIPLYCEPDGSFPHHHPDPVVARNLRDLQAMVVNSRADLGIGLDGDGDRLGVVDNTGGIVRGDRLLALFWREILPKYPGNTCIIEVKCSQALVEEVERLGGRPMFYKTGHSLIKAKMRETGAVFTGEMSGHFFFADEYYGFDDGLYAAGRLLRILSHSGRSLAELFQDLPDYPATGETRIPCADRDKFRVVEELRRELAAKYPVITVDGVRAIFPGGWGLVRASNTQPALVSRCEGKTSRDLQRIKEELARVLASFPELGEFTWEE
ncbi:MAG: phosphomannomutase/phosphoglucomutase [Bacillota bacterium]|nr:phosphomannomutase/phosphoglucomutase [Bacillota bacterium]